MDSIFSFYFIVSHSKDIQQNINSLSKFKSHFKVISTKSEKYACHKIQTIIVYDISSINYVLGKRGRAWNGKGTKTDSSVPKN